MSDALTFLFYVIMLVWIPLAVVRELRRQR